MKKYFICFLIMLSMILCYENVYADDISVKLNGVTLDFDVPPQIISDRTFVPMRKIFESLGATVTWNDETKTVTGRKNDTVVNLTIGSNVLLKNGDSKLLDVAPTIVDSRTLVPIRAIAEAFDCDVQWNDSSKTITIFSEHYINEGEVFDENGYIEFDGLRIVYSGIEEDYYSQCYAFNIYNNNDFDVQLTMNVVGVKKDGSTEFLGTAAFGGYDLDAYEKDKAENGWAIKKRTNIIKSKSALKEYADIYDFKFSDDDVGMDPDNDGYYDISFISFHGESGGNILYSTDAPESKVYKLKK